MLTTQHARAKCSKIGITLLSLCSAAKDATPLIFQRIHSDEEQSHLRIGSVKYSSKNWFIVITPEDAIRATVPSGGRDVLEEVGLIDGIALRVVNYSEVVSEMTNDGSGSSLESEDSDLLTPEIITDANERECYIGFSVETGRAQCYDNIDNINVRLNVIPVLA